MDAENYKSICSRPDVFQRAVIESTARAIKEHEHLSLKLLEIINGAAINKPDLHTGSNDSDFFRIKIDAEEAEQIEDYLLSAEAHAVGENGETTSAASHFASLADAWRRYIDFCENEIIK
jgi:hypothetical protein